MSLTYIFREDPNYRQVAPVNNTNTTYTPSVDRVVDRIHYLAGDINELTKTATRYGTGVGRKASETVDHLNLYFQNLSHGAHSIADIATEKFDEFPVRPFYAILICALIAIIVALCYFVSFGGHYIIQRRQDKAAQRVLTEEDI